MLVEELRAEPRRPPHQEAVCRLLLSVGGVAGPTVIRNLSAGGAGLITYHPFERGTVVTVELINPRKNFTRSLPVRVVHASPQADGRWLIGFMFLDKLTEEQVAALTDTSDVGRQT